MELNILQSLMSATRKSICMCHLDLGSYFVMKKYSAEAGEQGREYYYHNLIADTKKALKKLVAQQKELKACYYEELAMQKAVSDDELYFAQVRSYDDAWQENV